MKYSLTHTQPAGTVSDGVQADRWTSCSIEYRCVTANVTWYHVWSADLLSAVSMVDWLTNEGLEWKILNTQAVNDDKYWKKTYRHSRAHTLPITLKH